MSNELSRLLSDPTKIVTTNSIEEAARQSGMLTMLQDGMLKVINGETTLDELYRVVG
jgi:type II secretory ATPase GspE/PulE/Tfp pilus assembly ATPase PilB-like protein